MSAGLMSCVRENSPPLENSSGAAVQVQDIPITITTPETAAPATDTTKRKRFHPLRNLRRIFRRRTVSSADRVPGQLGAKGSSPTHIHFATPPGCSTTDATLPRTGFGVPITIRSGGDSTAGTSAHHQHHHHHHQQQLAAPAGGGIGGYFKRETYRLRNSDDLDKDMSDYQRSLSEGRLVDSDISRDGLSQSHDSVFSESAGTASSLSITLKNELADVLRKRRKDRQGEVSDEDLGLPLSPITPQRKDRGMNKSEGSLSILSMTSSDLDLDERSTSNASGHNLLHLDSSASGHSIGLNRSDNMDESGDSSKLSHSAAKHKLAVRPKKKGPTRARTRPARETSLLPATPEVNEDSLKLSTCNIADVTKHSAEAEEKAHSLPYVGVMPVVMTPAAPVTGSSSSTTELTASSSIYVNKTLSKSHQEFDGAGGATRKDDDGFFKRILNYSFKKKKHEKEETAGSPKREENTSSVYITPSEGTTDPGAGEQLMKLSLVVGEADAGAGEQQQLASGYRKIKSGPAARQRIFPKDIYGSGEEQQHQHHQRYSSNVEVNRQSVASSSGSGHSLLAVAGEGGRGPLHKSEEYLSSAKVRKFSERSVDEGGEGDDEESDGLRKYVSHGEGGRVKSTGAGKVYGQSAYQQKLAKMSVTQQQQQQQDSSPSKRKAVEKSKSFRTYTDNVSNNLQQAGGGTSSAGNGTAHGHQLPSLPNLSSSLSVGNFSTNNFLETEHKFFSMTDNMNAGKQRVFKDYISNAGDDGGDGRLLLTSSASLQKFEINDNNLLNPREEYYDHQPKSIVLTTNTLTPPEPSNSSILHKSNQNISQIEETIDKLVSSQFVSIIRSSDSDGSSTERLDDVGGHVPEFMKIQLNRVDGASSGRTGPPARTNVVLTSSPTPVPPTSPAIDRSPPTEPVDTVRMRRFSNENIEITESKPPLPPSAARTSLDGGGGVPRSPPAFRKQSSGGGSGDVPGSKRNSMNLSQELSDDRKVILQRRTSVTEEKIKYERRISSSSEDIKYEKRKSTSEEVLEKQPRAGGGPAGGGGVNSSYTSGSSSGDELVVLRKKFVVDREGRREKDSTPELMKVFARRSLKLRSDDDYKVVSTGGGLEGKSMCSIDSDKENQSSEEKLDKVGVAKHHHHHQQQQQEAPASLSGPPSSNGSMTSTSSLGTAKGCPELGNKNGVTTTAAPVSSDPSAGGEPILRKNTTSKPFGVPNRFSNLANGQSGRNATSFIDVRKTLLPPSVPTASANGNNNNNNTGKSATTNNGESGGDGPPSVNNNNNNNHHNHHHHSASSNRHTIASLNQLNSAGGGGGVVVIANNNLVPTIEAIGGGVGGGGGEINEFKGILQRRAEWEKRAKEGFK
ncbi:serine-rich adhesin for platelets [Anopheles cruzii]|uniref:serine-rich adhesin for platelets n=1 Tax=Anopheles cruzii TaxID=68878 RepID=UPI0022EC56CA|nr:serine-rich adhesin for platelets [Anopheles cruzii]